MRFVLLITIFGLGSLPGIVSAAVTINEVAWMGDNVSANHEWIELYNDSQTAVAVDGWTLNDGMNLSITLSGTINPLEYAVLERTSDDSAVGSAFLLYTGALVNSGATLRLYDNNGSLVDQVAGGENWLGIGGDNASKETAQYSTSGWHTATPTPGKVNAEEAVVTTESTNTTAVSGSSGNKAAVVKSTETKVIKLGENQDELKLTMTVDNLAYVNQVVDFSVKASGVGKTIANSLKYTWNFGDLNSAGGFKTKHSYQYPGKYVITLRAKFAEQEEMIRKEITVLPVAFSLVRNEQGDIEIQNNAQYEIDISGYQLVGMNTVIIPPDTIMLPRGTITVPRNLLEDLRVKSLVMLYDGTKQAVAYSKPAVVGGVVATGELRSNSPVTKSSAVTSFAPLVYASEPEVTTEASLTEANLTDDKISPPATKSPVKPDTRNWPYLALIGLISFSLLLVWQGTAKSKQISIFD